MSDARPLLRHFLATLAYRTAKATRDAPESFDQYRVAPGVRTPRQLIRHMTSVLEFARSRLAGPRRRVDPLPTLAAEVDRFHAVLEELSEGLAGDAPLVDCTEAELLQGPLADAMTHAGQLAMLRRCAGSPIPPEDFSAAAIDPDNVSPDQPGPVRPSSRWLDAEEEPA